MADFRDTVSEIRIADVGRQKIWHGVLENEAYLPLADVLALDRVQKKLRPDGSKFVSKR